MFSLEEKKNFIIFPILKICAHECFILICYNDINTKKTTCQSKIITQ